MKIDELKIKVDEAGLQYGKLPDGGSAGCTSKCFLFSSKA